MTPALSEVGAGVAALIAGLRPGSGLAGYIVWVQRALLVIPLLQLIGVIGTPRRLKRWRRDPSRHPSVAKKWGVYILLPIDPEPVNHTTLIPLIGVARGFWMLYLPDYSWIAII